MRRDVDNVSYRQTLGTILEAMREDLTDIERLIKRYEARHKSLIDERSNTQDAIKELEAELQRLNDEEKESVE